jgi:isoquinoline 1-oxidoreductase beta subunit
MKVTRRGFLATGAAAAAGGALVVGFRLEHTSKAAQHAEAPPKNPFDAWIILQPDGSADLVLNKCEMGQGVYTGLPMILADEAELDWTKVRVRQSLDSTGTGGSGSTSGSYLPLRQAGAVVREAMLLAAATTWSVPRESCTARDSRVTHAASGRSLAYSDLVATARRLPLPEAKTVPLKDPSQFRLIGRSTPALDIPSKVMGSAQFGLDVRRPGMVYAMIARCPTFGGKMASYDASQAPTIPGVLKVFPIEPRGTGVHTAGGVVVIANTTWAAMRGRDALKITWDHGPHHNESSEGYARDLHAAVAGEGKVIRSQGEVAIAATAAPGMVEAIYEFPFLAHATMEPMNTTIHLDGNRCEVWCPSQSPDWARSAIAKELGFSEQQVIVHATFMGGGFGRRFMGDYPTEAAQIARQVNGPVQLVWSREDDMTHDFYRPASLHRMRGAVNSSGEVIAWTHHIASTPIRTFWDSPETAKPEEAEMGGTLDPPYSLPALKVSYTPIASGVPRGWWRSVEHSSNGFAVECFVDELAFTARRDPYRFRRDLLAAAVSGKHGVKASPELARLIAVLDLAADKAGWNTPLASGHGRGIACGTAYGYLAQVAEVSLEGGNLRVHRLVTAVDCGQIVNPDGVRQQIEGAAVFTLGAVLKQSISIANGQVQETNFTGYDPIRMPETPRLEVYFVENHLAPSGIGEAGVPYLGPAVANAVFAATGKRLRKLPLSLAEVG